jgi:quinoprotein glucose dehydrogenase
MLKSKLVSALRLGRLASFLSALLLWFIQEANAAAPASESKSYEAKVAPASTEAELAMKGFQVASGLKVELFAAEPHLANPVAFYIDEKGRFYVSETFRLHDGVTDIRGKNDWLDEDLASRTVNDRLAMMKRHLGEGISTYAIHPDRLKLIEDRDGDGKADHSTVFADGFNHPLDGIGAGVLARKGQVWFANLPNLWLLRDTNGDGVADERKSLHYGFGVRVGFLGHDLHGLRFGPDGKLYFSIGDRASHVETEGKVVGHPDTGCVFRCNPDGSELEVFAFGLRNPQELAFDLYGNLFTGDNNSDGGDRARWVYVVEGGDSGWRVGYQFIESPNSRGPWNSEKIWYPQWEGQAAHIVPPIANLANGPSGLTYYPGTGMPDRYNGYFFLCDFRGGRGSGIHSFTLKPKGATFELVDRQNFLWECLPTDVDFGVEGGIYYTDWVAGWNKTGKGRIYRVYDPDVIKQPIVQETKKLLGEGMDRRSMSELARLLAHRDMRVRQEAQFALAEKGRTAIKTLADVTRANPSQLARIHSIWGLGQIIANFKRQISNTEAKAAIDPLLPLLVDKDPEIRAQATKVLGDVRIAQAFDGFVKLLADPVPRVRFFAAQGLGRLGRKEAFPAILAMLRDNADQDTYLRHAGVMALVGISDVDALLAAAKDNSSAVRMGVLLALRRLERAEIAQFLNDPDPLLVVEAARAINDQPINGAMPELAALISRDGLGEPALRRALNANVRAGTSATAEALARFANNKTAPERIRGEALQALADWPKPSGRDRVIGVWRPVAATREARVASQALQPVLAEILRSAPNNVRIAAIQSVTRLEMRESDPVLFELVADTQAAANVRAEALKALAGGDYSRLAEAVKLAAADPNDVLRREAARVQARIQPSDAAGQLAAVLDKGTIAEKQNALTTLGTVAGASADELLGRWLDKLAANQAPSELQLDLLDAATKRAAPTVKEKLAKYESMLKKDDPLAPFRVALHGGDAQAGKKIFVERAEAACLRCHKVNGEGGEVGPDLTGLGTRQNREYILESLILPNKQVAAGFESVLVTLKNGMAYAGVLKSENDNELVLNSPEDGLLKLKKADIASRVRGLSAMPEGLNNILTKRDLRDLVEFLVNLK